MLLIDEIKNKLTEKGLSNSSINLYLKNLQRLNSNLPVKNLTFLNNVDDIVAKLSEYKPNTQRNYLIAIVSILGVLKDNKKYEKMYKLYSAKMNLLVDDIKKIPTEDKSESQKENWIEWNGVKEIHDKLAMDVNEFINNKTINEVQYTKLLDYMILSLYYLQAPRRNKDYQFMNVIKTFNPELSKEINYLVFDSNEFYFNNYKTSTKIGQQIIKYNDTLKEVMIKYFKFHPLIKNKKLTKNSNINFLVNYDGKPINKINSITIILNRIFNKKISSSMLRHIYLSSKYKDVNEAMKNDADAMAHGLTTQKDYIKV